MQLQILPMHITHWGYVCFCFQNPRPSLLNDEKAIVNTTPLNNVTPIPKFKTPGQPKSKATTKVLNAINVKKI